MNMTGKIENHTNQPLHFLIIERFKKGPDRVSFRRFKKRGILEPLTGIETKDKEEVILLDSFEAMITWTRDYSFGIKDIPNDLKVRDLREELCSSCKKVYDNQPHRSRWWRKLEPHCCSFCIDYIERLIKQGVSFND